MAINRQKKEEILRDLKDRFSGVRVVVFVDYSGSDAKSLEGVRGEFRKEGINFKVVKKNLLDLSMKEAGIEGRLDSLQGQVAAVFGYSDEIAAAKIVYKLSGSLENLRILSGILDGEFVDYSKIVALATMPSRDELIARVVGSIRAPIYGLVTVMQGNLRGLVQVLNAISQKS